MNDMFKFLFILGMLDIDIRAVHEVNFQLAFIIFTRRKNTCFVYNVTESTVTYDLIQLCPNNN